MQRRARVVLATQSKATPLHMRMFIMGYETTLYVIYITCMALGALTFVIWSRNPKGVPATEYLIATLIPIWSGLAYLAMALGLGQVEIDGQITFWARYADWIVTTPLLLLALSWTAMCRLPKKNKALVGALIAADVIMIGCGLIGDLSSSPARYIFFGVGVVALVAIFVMVWGPLRRIAASQGEEVEGAYTKVAAYLSLFWIGYPTTWMLGPSGLGIVSQQVDTFLFILLPIFSKVGFSLLDLSLLRRILGGEGAEHTLSAHPS